ncbi:MFS transporter, partial [Pseudonocardia sp. KRD291]|uniref:MFS transporter n=1 Tax=Pseudonocardia sp. KRD291 TaxID=2792007 RepID=UPI001C4A001E
THTLGTETVPQRWRGLVSGLVGGGGAGLGAVIASLVFLAVSSAFPGPAFDEWGWRVMFFTGLLASLASLAFFRLLEESPVWAAAARARATAAVPEQPVRARDLVSAVTPRTLVASTALVIGAGAQYYLTSGYLPTFLDKINQLPTGPRGLLLVWTSLAILPMALLAGHASERFGRRPVFLAIGAVNLVALPLLALAMGGLGPDDTGALLGYGLLITVLANASYAAVPIFLNELFPTRLRATATALIWNGGFALGGLTTTFVSLASPTVADIPGRLALFLVAVVAVFLLGAAFVPETRGALDRDDPHDDPHDDLRAPAAPADRPGTLPGGPR